MELLYSCMSTFTIYVNIGKGNEMIIENKLFILPYNGDWYSLNLLELKGLSVDH